MGNVRGKDEFSSPFSEFIAIRSIDLYGFK